MKKTLIPRSSICGNRTQERGITMLLVALAMVAIIGMAALSIDVITLYLAREEAQHSADSAALGAAKVLSLSGITGDPTNVSGNWGHICGPDNGTNGLATRVAKAIATQNTVGGAVPTTINVTYSAGSASSTTGTSDCTSLNNTAFGVNPVVTVQIIRTGVPNFFSRIWGSAGTAVSGTASAEAFNPSNSASVAPSGIIPVQPRCVKPWIVPNLDPLNPSTTCGTNSCLAFVNLADGHIIHPGMSVNGGNTTGVIGERFLLVPDCQRHITAYCAPQSGSLANQPTNGSFLPTQPNLEYLPGQTLYPSAAVPSSASAGSAYEQAIAGCDQTTVYYCGVPSAAPIGNGPNMVDLNENPASTDDTTNGVMALIHEGNPNPNGGQPDGQDSFSTYGNPPSYPFQIFPGSGNPTGLANTIPITASNSVVSLPIYDQTANPFTVFSPTPVAVTIVGFLQVFINAADQYGNVDVTVLNVSGCSNGSGSPVGTAITANSPVPVRLITPP